MTGKALNRDLAKDNPERVFSGPGEIVDEVLMTRGEKLATLTRWRQTVLEELSASGEGMRTHGVSSDRMRLLEEIEQARVELAAGPDSRSE
jgi:hypothetical protein